ncbi:hypothetical protein E3Q06_01732 [Wallemia mellicola]|nr:hypothetical protein E3Q24_01641 [Wallemia mellicola]TIB85873.1 hypothetical protein E3Q21_01823 [Wallemia mellicola]TIB88999.1 hypothetical protein E3Q20_01816 [Wallemia mellicola]TIC41039.1 hypothetical protein E3Q07_01811 [Wallemia mellicola]TIC49675.1 hypothetical protein E3Q06_01732 [Wallemia mellicola]
MFSNTISHSHSVQYGSAANQVADAIHDHITCLKPHYRLPVLYLIDSISKNLSQLNYAQHFAPFIAKDWLNTYALVDGATRSKLEELVITWRNGGPYGSNLFGRQAQLDCEQRLYGQGGWKASIPLSYGPSRTLVITELQAALEKRKVHVQYYPYDEKAKSHIHALSTLEKILLTTNVPPDQLNQIYERVKSMSNDAPAGATPVVASTPSVPPPLPTPAIISTPAPAVQPAAPIPVVAAQLNPLLQSNTPPPPPPPPPQPQPQQPQVGSNVSGLLQSLQASGLLKTVNAGNSASTVTSKSKSPQPEQIMAIDSQDDEEKEKAYDQAVLALDIVLDNNDILCPRPNLDKLFYDRLTVQCPQCSRRFADTSTGKKQLAEHIDTHFRINRRNKEGSRGVTRSWLIVLKDWMNDVADDSVASQRGPIQSHEDNEQTQQAEYKKQLESMTVPVPADAEDAAKVCPICKEKFKGEFSEEDEEWVWKNALEDGETIYHATCHNDSFANNSGLQTLHWRDQEGKQRKWENAFRTTRSEGGVDAVSIAAVLKYKNSTKPSDVILVEQYRPPVDSNVIEFPAGLIDKAVQAAIRELREETGYQGDSIRVIDESPVVANDPGMSNANMESVTIVVDDIDENAPPPLQELDDVVNGTYAIKRYTLNNDVEDRKMAKNPFNSKAPENNRGGPMSSLSVQSYHQDSPPFTGQANDEEIPPLELLHVSDSNRSPPNSSTSAQSEPKNQLRGKAAFSPMYSPRPDGSAQPSPHPMLSDLPSSAANAIASRAVRPSVQRESSQVGIARDRVPKEPMTAPEAINERHDKAPVTPNPFSQTKDFSPPDLDEADLFGEDGYIFPKHKLKGMMEDEEKIPLVIVACGSFSPPTYLHLRGYYSPVSDAYKKSGLAGAKHRVMMCHLGVECTSDWLMVDPWEANKKEFTRTAHVLDHFDQEINECEEYGVKLRDGSRRKVQIMLLAGGDLIESFGEPGVWSEDDLNHILGKFGCLIVERTGSDVWAFLLSHDLLYKHRRNVIVVKQLIYNDISSTKLSNGFCEMAKSKNHTNHNQSAKAHRNLKFSQRARYPSKKGVDPKFLRNQRYATQGNIKKALAIRKGAVEAN